MTIRKFTKCLPRILVAVIISALGCSKAESPRKDPRPKILLRASLGDIVIELFADRAPVTTSNFIRYVDENRYKSASFYRAVTLNNQSNSDVKIQIIQGGIGPTANNKQLPPITHEATERTGILHVDGTISMARREPNTAASEFFVCVGDQPELNFGGKRNKDIQGFAAFGE